MAPNVSMVERAGKHLVSSPVRGVAGRDERALSANRGDRQAGNHDLADCRRSYLSRCLPVVRTKAGQNMRGLGFNSTSKSASSRGYGWLGKQKLQPESTKADNSIKQ
jgi:hypothetical protein